MTEAITDDPFVDEAEKLNFSDITPPRRRGRAKRPDPKPKVEEKPRDADGISAASVEEVFAQILSLPALVYKAPGTPFHCDWCAGHFARQGPQTAKELVENRAHYPALYAGMEKIAAAWLAFSLMPMVINYAAPPVVHHGPSLLEPLSPLFGVPARTPNEDVNESENGSARHRHSSATDGTVPSQSIPPNP